jgi:hypothetical protein
MECNSCRYNFSKILSSSLLSFAVSVDPNYIDNLHDPPKKSELKSRYLVGVTNPKSGLFRILTEQKSILKKLFLVVDGQNRPFSIMGYSQGVI